MQHAWEILEMHTNFWSENLKGRDHSEDVFVNAKIVLEWILGKRLRRCGLDLSVSE